MKENAFSKILKFFKRIFIKENVKLIEEVKEDEHTNDFELSLKRNVVNNKVNKIKGLICNGDGLGIHDNISY